MYAIEAVKNGELIQTPWSKSSWTFVGLIVKISSVLSAMTNRALIGFDLTGTPSFFESFSASSWLSFIITLMSTFLFFSLLNMSLKFFNYPLYL